MALIKRNVKDIGNNESIYLNVLEEILQKKTDLQLRELAKNFTQTKYYK